MSNRNQLPLVAAVLGAVVATASLSALAFNAAHPVPQAPGLTIGGWDWAQAGNAVLAFLGGSAGIWGLVKTLIGKVAPDLGNAIDNPLAKQFIGQLPMLLQIISGGKTARGKLVFSEDLNGVPVTVTIDVGNQGSLTSATLP